MPVSTVSGASDGRAATFKHSVTAARRNALRKAGARWLSSLRLATPKLIGAARARFVEPHEAETHEYLDGTVPFHRT